MATNADEIEILKACRTSLFMWNMDVQGVDRMLEARGVDVATLPQYEFNSAVDNGSVSG